MVEGGSEKAFAQWLAERPQSFCEKVEAVAMDAFAGYKKAAARQVPHAVEILDPFHIVKLAGDKVTAVRCRLQREATGRRGTRTDPLYRGRRILLKTASLRTDRQKKRADELLGDPSNKPLALAHGVYQKIIACYAQEDRGKGRGMMAELIESLAVKGGAPGCPELLQRDAHTSQFAVHARPVGLLVGTLDRTPAGKQQGIHLVIGFCPPHHRRRHRAGRRRRTH